MFPRSYNPDAHGPWSEELSDQLRAAVGELRDELPPPDAARRALDHARRLGAPRPPRRRRWPTSRISLLVTGAIAAALLTSLGWQSEPPLIVRSRDHNRVLPRPSPTFAAHRDASPSGLFVFPSRWGEPGQDVKPIGLVDLGRDWSAWERTRALRKLSGTPSIEPPVHAFVRHEPGRTGKPLPQGRVVCEEERNLTLVGLYVQVVIEGPRVRTLIDHLFSNPTREVQSGTFECSLPQGDSPSYFAVFPGGQGGLREEKAQPRPVRLPSPERLVRNTSKECWGEPRCAAVVAAQRKSTESTADVPLALGADEAPQANFRAAIGRVRPGTLIRVVVASEGALPVHAGKASYRFSLPACKVNDLGFSLQVDEALARDATFAPPAGKVRRADGRVIYSRKWTNYTGPGEVRFDAPLPDPNLEATCGRHGDSGPRYLCARVRPEFPAAEKEPAFAGHAIFLVDTSAAEDPKRYATSVRLLKAILEKDAELKHFNVLTFSTGPAWLSPSGWLANTKEVRDKVVSRLEAAALEGATDVAAALQAVAKPAWAIPNDLPVNAFLLSDGQPTWGEADVAGLVARFETQCRFPVRWHCFRAGLGSENEELFAALTRRGGGTYRVSGADDLAAASVAHRSRCLVIEQVAFEGGPDASEVLVAGRQAAVCPGGDLLVAARFANAGRTHLVVKGTVGGKKFEGRYALEIGDRGELAPRAWGELAMASLLSVNDPSLEPLAVTIGRQFRVASRVTSFAYVQGDPDEDVDETNVTARIEQAWQKRGDADSVGSRDRVRELLREAVPLASARRDVTLLLKLMRDDDLPWPTGRAEGALTPRKDLPAKYLDATEPAAYLDEATRRVAARDRQGAIRVLSGMLERSAEKSNAVQLMAYRLIGTGEAEMAAWLLLEQTKREPHDPALHRALGLALSLTGRHAWAALHYETAMALMADQGGWFRAVRAEYGDLLAIALRDERLRGELRDHFRTRLREVEGTPSEAALRVGVTWNTVASVVDLELTDPDGKLVDGAGTKLKGDRQGPRVFQVAKPHGGAYQVAARLAKTTPETAPETCAIVVVRQGAAQERRERQVILLRQTGERAKVTEVRPQK